MFLMRGEEIRQGIAVYPVLSDEEKARKEKDGVDVQSLGKSQKAATLAVAETALSRVLNSTPVMAIPPLILVRLQRMEWLKRRPKLTLPVNLGGCRALFLLVRTVLMNATGLILTTSVFALPLALAAFPQRQAVLAQSLEEEFWSRGGKDGKVEFNRGI